MAKILQFPQKPTDDHMRGDAVCLACGHKWLAAAPVGTVASMPSDDRVTLECEKCGAAKGVFTKFVQYTDIPSWHCLSCNGFLFSILLIKDVPSCACASCGSIFNALDLFNK